MLAGIIISTEQLDKMSEFYSIVLGIKPNNVDDSHVSFHFGDFKLIITTHDQVIGKSKDKYRTMINFAVDDIYKWYNKLLSLKIKIIQDPYTEDWGGHICTFEDIDENIIQFIQIN
tara:strand:+ start:599 stop:946 length:348 start_codon:yes stop_codon:yes gene_type:complete